MCSIQSESLPRFNCSLLIQKHPCSIWTIRFFIWCTYEILFSIWVNRHLIVEAALRFQFSVIYVPALVPRIVNEITLVRWYCVVFWNLYIMNFMHGWIRLLLGLFLFSTHRIKSIRQNVLDALYHIFRLLIIFLEHF